MTVRDGAAYLAQALTSLRAQTFRQWELVLRDDGSTDDSVVIAREFAARDERIRVLAGDNVGRRRALVEAHAMARGKYLAWLDGDDWLAPAALEKAHWALTSSQSDLVYTDHIIVSGDGEQRGLGRRTRVPYSSHRLLLDFMTFHFRLFTRDIFERAGGISPDREIAIDYDLCLRISEIGRIQHLAEPLYFYRQHPEQMSSRRRAEQIAASAAAIRSAIARRFLDYDLFVDEAQGRFHLRPRVPKRPPPSWRRIARALISPRTAAAHPPPRLPRPSATTPAVLGYWPGRRPTTLQRPLFAAIEARGVHVRSLGPDLASLMRAVWTGRAGDVLHIHDLSPLFAAPDAGSVIATIMLFAKTLDHARARGARVVWTPLQPLAVLVARPHYARCLRELARRCDCIVTHWPADVETIGKLGPAGWACGPYPSLAEAFPLLTREAARTALGLDPSARIRLHLTRPAATTADDLVLDGDLSAYPARHVAAYFAAADVVQIASPDATALAIAMVMGRPVVAPPSMDMASTLGGDGADGAANARRARAVPWAPFVDAILGVA
jgi:hypothetical protein